MKFLNKLKLCGMLVGVLLCAPSPTFADNFSPYFGGSSSIFAIVSGRGSFPAANLYSPSGSNFFANTSPSSYIRFDNGTAAISGTTWTIKSCSVSSGIMVVTFNDGFTSTFTPSSTTNTFVNPTWTNTITVNLHVLNYSYQPYYTARGYASTSLNFVAQQYPGSLAVYTFPTAAVGSNTVTRVINFNPVNSGTYTVSLADDGSDVTSYGSFTIPSSLTTNQVYDFTANVFPDMSANTNQPGLVGLHQVNSRAGTNTYVVTYGGVQVYSNTMPGLWNYNGHFDVGSVLSLSVNGSQIATTTLAADPFYHYFSMPTVLNALPVTTNSTFGQATNGYISITGNTGNNSNNVTQVVTGTNAGTVSTINSTNSSTSPGKTSYGFQPPASGVTSLDSNGIPATNGTTTQNTTNGTGTNAGTGVIVSTGGTNSYYVANGTSPVTSGTYMAGVSGVQGSIDRLGTNLAGLPGGTGTATWGALSNGVEGGVGSASNAIGSAISSAGGGEGGPSAPGITSPAGDDSGDLDADNFWQITIPTGHIMGIADPVLDFNPAHSAEATAIAVLVRNMIIQITLVLFFCWVLKIQFGWLKGVSGVNQTFGLSGGFLGGGVSGPSGLVYLTIITTSLLLIIPAFSAYLSWGANPSSLISVGHGTGSAAHAWALLTFFFPVYFLISMFVNVASILFWQTPAYQFYMFLYKALVV